MFRSCARKSHDLDSCPEYKKKSVEERSIFCFSEVTVLRLLHTNIIWKKCSNLQAKTSLEHFP